MPPSELQIIIRAVNLAQATLTQMQASLQQLLATQQQLVASSVAVGQAASGATTRLNAMGTGVMSLADRIERALVFFVAFRLFWTGLNFITQAIDNLVQLEQQLKRVQSATIFDPSGMAEQEAILKRMTFAMVTFGLSAKDVGNALFELVSAGLSMREAGSLLNTVLGLVKAGVSDIGTASRATAAIFKVWGTDAQRIGDVLSFVLNRSQVEINGLITGLQRVAGIAKIAGLSFEQTTVALAMLNDGMVFGGNAGRALRRAIEQLAQESDFLSNKFGIVTDSTKTMGEQFESIIAQLAQKIASGQALPMGLLAQFFERFGILGTAGVAILREFSGKYGVMVKEVTDGAGKLHGSLQAIVAIRMDTLLEQWNRFTNSFAMLFSPNFFLPLKDLLTFFSNIATFGGISGATVTSIQFGVQEALRFTAAVQAGHKALTDLNIEQVKQRALGSDLSADQQARQQQLTTELAANQQEWERVIRELTTAMGRLPVTLQEILREQFPIFEQWGVLPKLISQSVVATTQLQTGISEVSLKTREMMSTLKDVPLGDRLAGAMATMDEIATSLQGKLFIIRDVTKGWGDESNRTVVNMKEEGVLAKILQAASEGRLANIQAYSTLVDKNLPQLVKEANEVEKLRTIQKNAMDALLEQQEKYFIASGLELGLQEKLNRVIEVRKQTEEELFALLQRSGMGQQLGQGMMLNIADLDLLKLSGEELKTFIALHGKLLELLAKEQAIQRDIYQQQERALTQTLRIQEVKTAALLRQIDLEERGARAARLFTDADEQVFNARRIGVLREHERALKDIIVSLKQMYDVDLAGGALSAEQAIKRQEELEKLGAQLGVVQVKIQDLEATQGGFWEAFLRGTSAGLSEMSTGFKETFASAKRLIIDLQRALSDGLFDVMTKGFTSMGDLLNRLKESLLRFIADFASKRLIAGVFGPLLTFLGDATTAAAGGTSTGSGGGGFLSSLFGGGGFGFGGIGNLFSGFSDSILTGIFDLFTGGGTSFLGFGGSGAAGTFGQLLPTIATFTAFLPGIFSLLQGEKEKGIGSLAGAGIGAFFGPIGAGIGALIGGLIGGLFKGTPKGGVDVQLQNRFMTEQEDFLAGRVGSVATYAGGDLHKNQAPAIAVAQALDTLLRTLLTGTLTATKDLPQQLQDQIQQGLKDLAVQSPFISQGMEVKLKGDNLQRELEKLPNMLIALFAEAVFGGVDLQALQLDGEALGDTFGRVLTSMSGLSILLDAMGSDADAFVASLGTGQEALAAYVLKSVEFFTRFIKEGEAVNVAIQRVVAGFVGLQALVTGLGDAIDTLGGTGPSMLTLFRRQIDQADQVIEGLADRLHVAITAGGQPDEILAMAQQLTELTRQRYNAEIDFVVQLQAQIDQLVTSFGGLALSLQEQIGSTYMRGTREDMARVIAQVTGGGISTQALAGVLPAIAGGLGDFAGTLPDFLALMRQAMGGLGDITDPEQALQALQSLQTAITTYQQQQTEAIQNSGLSALEQSQQLTLLNASMGTLLISLRDQTLAKMIEATEVQRATLLAITGGVPIQQFIAERTGAMADRLAEIRDALIGYMNAQLEALGGIKASVADVAGAVSGLAATIQPPGIGLQHGMAYVPYDNFQANLHRGERVLTAEQNRQWSDGTSTVTIAPIVNVTIEGGANLTAEDVGKAASKAIVYSLRFGEGAAILKERVRARN